MMRLTARVSCSRICSGVISGTLGSPRRSLASSSCAAEIAASPPLTATYIQAASVTRTLRGRAAMALCGGEEDVDAAGERGAIGAQTVDEIGRQRRRAESKSSRGCLALPASSRRRRASRPARSGSLTDRDRRGCPARTPTAAASRTRRRLRQRSHRTGARQGRRRYGSAGTSPRPCSPPTRGPARPASR